MLALAGRAGSDAEVHQVSAITGVLARLLWLTSRKGV